jgi:hypothetical protein
LTYLERQKCYGPDKKILFKKQLFDLEVKCQGPTEIITVYDTLPYGHAAYYFISQIRSGRGFYHKPWVAKILMLAVAEKTR